MKNRIVFILLILFTSIEFMIFSEDTKMIEAIKNNNEVLLSQILSEVDVKSFNNSDDAGLSPLHHAVKVNNYNMVNLLIKSGHPINVTNKWGSTPLHLSSMYSSGKNENIALLLLSKDADYTIKNNNGETPLHIAYTNKNYHVISSLLEKGADISVEDNNGQIACINAVYDYDLLKMLLEKRDITYEKGSVGEKLFKNAVKVDNLETVSLLIDHSKGKLLYYDFIADFLIETLSSGSVELFTVLYAESKIQKYIIADDHYSLLHEASKTDYSWLVEDLIGRGYNVNLKDSFGKTPLHYSVTNFHSYIADLLIEKCALIDEKDNYGNTPLYYAVDYKNNQVISSLINSGASIDIQNKWGTKLLDRAKLISGDEYVEYIKFVKEQSENIEDNPDSKCKLFKDTDNINLPVIEIDGKKINSISVGSNTDFTITYNDNDNLFPESASLECYILTENGIKLIKTFTSKKNGIIFSNNINFKDDILPELNDRFQYILLRYNANQDNYTGFTFLSFTRDYKKELTDLDGNVLPDVEYTLFLSNYRRLYGKTDKNGVISLENIPYGRVRFKFNYHNPYELFDY